MSGYHRLNTVPNSWLSVLTRVCSRRCAPRSLYCLCWRLQNRLLGGGFAGVESIGATNDLVHEALRYYPQLAPQEVRVVLVHPGEVVLPELGEKLGRYAQQKMVERGVEIRRGTKVTGYVNSLVAISPGEAVPAATLI